MQIIEVETTGQGLYEITGQVQRATPAGAGLLTLFVRHTSCSILIQENADPEVQADLTAFFARLVPPTTDPSMAYLTHTYEGPDDMPAHIKAALLPVSLSIPVQDGRLALGKWQGVYIFEHRSHPHRREVAIHAGLTRRPTMRATGWRRQKKKKSDAVRSATCRVPFAAFTTTGPAAPASISTASPAWVNVRSAKVTPSRAMVSARSL